MSKPFCFLSCRCRTASMDSGLRRNDSGERGGERGSAILYVFLGVALFGALLYMYSRSGSQSTSALTDQQAKITASEMISYARSLEGAVNRLVSFRGCSENEMSFEGTGISGYTNSDAPPDKHCHVFDVNGGGMKPYTAGSEFYSVEFINNSGSPTQADVVLKIKFTDNPDLCLQINNLLYKFGDTTLPKGWLNLNKYTGVFPTGTTTIAPFDSGVASKYLAKSAMCYQYATTATPQVYYFFYVLMAR